MSRIGKAPVPVPSGVTVTLDGSTITADMIVKQEGGEVIVTRPSDEQNHKALHGLTRTLVANMVEGVTKGYTKTLEITGVGYKAEVRPYGLQMALGYSHQ